MYRPHTSQNDYKVNNPPLCRENALPEWVGWKTINAMTRVGKEERVFKKIMR